jgi:hypothetical protein
LLTAVENKKSVVVTLRSRLWLEVKKKLIDCGVRNGLQRIMWFLFWTVFSRLRSGLGHWILRELILVNQLESNVETHSNECKSKSAQLYCYGFYWLGRIYTIIFQVYFHRRFLKGYLKRTNRMSKLLILRSIIYWL